MIKFTKKLKAKSYKLNQGMTHSMFTQGHPEYSRGMTYVELIVVLGIFAVMSSVAMFNYREFQAKVDIKNLSSDMALKVVEAQKSAMSGKLPLSYPTGWNPAYGVHFDIANSAQFIYFNDLNSPVDGYDDGEELDIFTVTKNNFISYIEICSVENCPSGTGALIDSLSVTFRRPDSSAIFTGAIVTDSEYIQITIDSPKDATAKIKIYPSGRVQVN